jgi:PAS domain S-box-containing protein
MGAWELDLRTGESPVRSPLHDRVFGYEEPLDDWGFDRFLEHVHPEDRERVRRSFEAAFETGEWAFECRIARADGAHRWIAARGEFYDEDGAPARAVGVIRDVTERRQHEEELAALNRLNRVIQDVTHQIIESATREEIERSLTDADAYEYAWIGYLDRHGRAIVPQIPDADDARRAGERISMTRGDPTYVESIAEAVRSRAVRIARDAPADPAFERWSRSGARSEATAPRSRISIPITFEERVYGVLNVYTPREGRPDERERRVIGRLRDIVGHAINSLERKRALLEDRVQQVTFRSEAIGRAMAAAAGDGPVSVSVDRTVPVADDRTLTYYTLEGIDPAGFLEAVEGLVGDLESRVVERTGTRSRVELATAEETLASQLARYDGRVVDAALRGDEFLIVVDLPPDADVRAVAEAIRAAHPDVELASQTEVERERRRPDDAFAAVDDALTERQRATLEVAYYAGYFDWPRGVTGEELARRLGVTQATASHHLRHGERKLLSAFLDPAGERGR